MVVRILVALLSALAIQEGRAQDLSTSVCKHQGYPNVGPEEVILDGQSLYREINFNQTHRWRYTNLNVTTMNQPDQYRKLIIQLEPCRGVVYLFVRKTRPCWPDPYSCIDMTPGSERRDPQSGCEWTHFMSEIDGSRDGAPTFFEVPLSSTNYYISVYSPFATKSAYTLTMLADTGAFPRPGEHGRIRARQLGELTVQISWTEANYIPTGISDTKQYWVYSAMLLDNDNRSNPAVFMRPDKILNTVCGLRDSPSNIRNTDRSYDTVSPATCRDGICNATIQPIITEKRYAFNIIVESNRGFMMAYSGLIMRTEWEVVRQAASDKLLKVIGAVAGSVMGMVVIIYFMLLKLYG